MESVHCYSCFCFPSKEIEFFISNCMHIFCGPCRDRHKLGPDRMVKKCPECKISPIKILKMGPDMPESVKSMFAPISEDINKYQREMTRVMTFQKKQKDSLIYGLSKKEENFDKLLEAHQKEKKEVEHYKRQLDEARRQLKEQNIEISELQSLLSDNQSAAQPPPPTATSSTPSMKVFSDSMYKTPKPQPKKPLPAFLRSKAKTTHVPKQRPPVPMNDEDPFRTPMNHPTTSLGFVTPSNPANLFPPFKKHHKNNQ